VTDSAETKSATVVKGDINGKDVFEDCCSLVACLVPWRCLTDADSRNRPRAAAAADVATWTLQVRG